MKLFVWAGVAIAVLFLLFKFRNGAVARANFGAQLSPSSWGSGMIYGPGYSPSPGGYFPGISSYTFGGQTPVQATGVGPAPWYAYLLNAPISAGYTNGDFNIGYGE